MYNIVLVILGIGLIQSAIFALLTIQKKKKLLSDWILIFWFLSFCIHFACIIMVDLKTSSIYLSLAKNFLLLYGPFLWFYSFSTYSTYSKSTVKIQFLHLVPFIVLTGASLTIVNNESLLFEVVLVTLKLSSLIVYPIYVLYWIKKKNTLFKTVSADSFITSSKWIKALAYLVLIVGILGALHIFSDIVLSIAFSEVLDILTYVLMITIMGYLGLRLGIIIDPNIKTELPQQSYNSSPLTSSEKSNLVTEITEYFNNTEDYLDHQFSLGVLSEKLNIPKHHLSEVINSEMNSTFYDLVNSRRVKYAVNRIQKSKKLKLTLEGLGYESGFNTKSAFYHHFKLYTGKTPGQVRKEISPD